MIIPDINLLIYAHDSDSPYHAITAAWWRTSLSESETVGLCPVVAFGFVRIATNPRVFNNPMLANEATGHVRSWLKQPNVQLLEDGPNYVENVFKLLENMGTAGNLVSDAQIAALTIDYDAVLHTADTDFLRFPGLRWFNPLSGVGSDTLRSRRTAISSGKG
jgi:toxin-antitoxin system PIN domain toxin